MFKLANRRYLGAKTRLLSQLDEALSPFLCGLKDGVFFDAFSGTGVVGEHFLRKSEFSELILNDLLYSNFVIFNGFFKFNGDFSRLELIAKRLNEMAQKQKSENFFGENFGGSFFSQNDASKIGLIRDTLDKFFSSGEICKSEFYVLLASLLYSADRVANTCGHYDAFRRVETSDKFRFELILPLWLDKKDKNEKNEKPAKQVVVAQKDANLLAKELLRADMALDVAFIDPPYNSRQYSRCYHFLETLAKNDKPKLSGVAKKPMAENLSEYCTMGAAAAFEELVATLAKKCKILAVTYNNTTSANARSNIRVSFSQVSQVLQKFGRLSVCEFDFEPFNAGKTKFDGHKEVLFVCECGGDKFVEKSSESKFDDANMGGLFADW